MDIKFKESILELRKNKKLHNLIEEKLILLFKEFSSDIFTLKEAYGTTTGRPDAVAYTWKGLDIHIEIIASASMVDRDLLNIVNSNAQIKLVILLDKEIDEKVPKKFYRKYNKSIPRLWISDLLLSERKKETINKLHKILEDCEMKISSQQEIQIQPNEIIFKTSPEWEERMTFSVICNSVVPLYEVYILLNINEGDAKQVRVEPVDVSKEFNEKFGVAELNFQFLPITGVHKTGKEFILLKIFQMNPGSKDIFIVRSKIQTTIDLHFLEYSKTQVPILKKNNSVAISFKFPESLTRYE